MENIALEPIISAIIYIIPLGTLIWKGASMANQIKQNTKDIEDLKAQIKDQNKNVIDALDRLNTTMLSIQADVTVLKTYRKIEIDKEK